MKGRSYLLFVLLAIILCAALLTACGGGNATQPGTNAGPTQGPLVLSQAEALPVHDWPAILPDDRPQPWEGRLASAVDLSADFTPGVERFNEAGDVTDLGEASRLVSGAPGAGELSYALYRIVLGGAEPGVVSADVNLRPQSEGSGSEYWLGLSLYSAGVWEWHGPYQDTHVRVSTGAEVAGGADYLSALGNLFIVVAVSDGARCDVVGLGVNAYDGGDLEAPPAPAAAQLTPVAGGLLLEWLPVAAGDLAGYYIYHRTDWFLDQRAVGVKRVGYVEGATRHLLGSVAGETYLRISAVDHSGNESALSGIVSGAPLAGEVPPLQVEADTPTAGLQEPLRLAASGAEAYDWDLDGDGIYDVTGDTTGQAAADTSATGIIRPAVRGTSGGGSAVALGAVSLIVSGNARPVANGYADPSYGFAPLTVGFTGAGMDPDGEIVLYSWDFDGNGTYDWSDPANSNPPEQLYSIPYLRNVKFRVDDEQGAYDVDTVSVQVLANLPPLAHLAADRTAGEAPFAVNFDASGSADLDGTIVKFEWDWEDDGIYDSDTGTSAFAEHTYDEAFEYDARLRVTDNAGATATAELHLVARGILLRVADDTVGVGIHCSLEVVNGNPAIAYQDDLNGQLMYVRAADADGTSWAEPVVVDSEDDVGSDTSLAVIDGNPAVSYLDITNGDLKYARASDANGGSWNSPVVVEGTDFVGQNTSLTTVNGNPAISYLRVTDEDLMYVRASDPQGESWNTPVPVYSSGPTGYYTSLAIVSGRPAISFMDLNAFTLSYVRATDADGTAWNAPVTLSNIGTVAALTSLTVVNGHPAVAFTVPEDYSCGYIRANDSTGATWNPLVSFDYYVGSVSLALINGRPAISYHVGVGSNLMYTRATDENGAAWAAPTSPDSSGSVGWYSSLAEVNGRAAISYYDGTNGVLKYALIIE